MVKPRALPQLLRYLAEIVWVPRAIAANDYIEWQQFEASKVRGSLRLHANAVELRFTFDPHGDIVRVKGKCNRDVDGRSLPTPWIGSFSGYAVLGGVRVPTRGEVQWLLDDGAFPYWRGQITSLDHDPANR